MAKDSLGIAEKIKQLKELLDIGAITQEEFEYKKIALLNPDKEDKYLKALELIKQNNENSLSNAVMLLNNVGNYRNAEELLIETTERAEKAKNKALYDNAIQLMEENTIVSLNNAINKFRHITDGYDVQKLITTCEEHIVKLKQQQEEEEKQRKLAEEKAEAEKIEALEKTKKESKTRKIIFSLITITLIVLGIVFYPSIYNSVTYNSALSEYNSKNYVSAYDKFSKIQDYKDSSELAFDCSYNIKVKELTVLIKSEDFSKESINKYITLFEKNYKDYKKSNEYVAYCNALIQTNLNSIEKYYKKANGVFDSSDRLKMIKKAKKYIGTYKPKNNIYTSTFMSGYTCKYKNASIKFSKINSEYLTLVFTEVYDYEQYNMSKKNRTESVDIYIYKNGDIEVDTSLTNYYISELDKGVITGEHSSIIYHKIK